ncbi:ComF family protein [Klugiella xanthotipulae]|nr:phosphoribosyltransferase family protein [Klugiella xanthotipulae]
MTHSSSPRPLTPHTARALFREAALDIAALCVPTHCVLCAAPDRSLCRGCATVLHPRPTAQRLAPLVRQGPAAGPPAPLPPVFSACPYTDAVRGVIVAVKERGRSDAIPALARLLAEGILASDALACGARESRPSLPLVVPLPSTRASERARGFRHMECAARGAIRVLRQRGGYRLSLRPWLCSRPRRDQVGLGRDARIRNVTHTMSASPRVRGCRVLLVDDLITTGASVREACRALHAAGAQVVGIVTIAYAQRHSS